ncbi:MAG: DsbA family protein [Patescibacteria group bacterium]
MSGKAWIIFGAVCVVLFGGLVIWSGRDRVDVSGIDTNKIQPAAANSGDVADHVFGNPDAKVVLVEYGDFQCPGCGGVHPTVKTLSEKYEDQMAFVFRNFPLTSIHPNARAAAAAAEAAGKEGKYWEVHNALFEAQNEWSSASTSERGNLFVGYAEQAGLSKADFNSVLSEQSASLNKKINFDIALGRKIGVTGTPTFYLNGKKLSDDQFGSAEALEKTILDELKKQGVTIPEADVAPETS